MKSYFKVTFEYAEGIYCTNLAHAETAEDVEREYSRYSWRSIKTAQPWDVEEARAKGMPIIEVEPAEEPDEAPAADPETVTTTPAEAAQAATEAPEQPTTDEQKEEDNTMSNTANDLQKYVDGIAADLRRLYEADPTDEEREAAEENGDACDLYSYFTDVLDIEYTISSRGDYLGARIAVALGGPNIYIDTREGYVKGYWGTDREEAWIPSEICEEIDSIMEEYYDMVRGA